MAKPALEPIAPIERGNFKASDPRCRPSVPPAVQRFAYFVSYIFLWTMSRKSLKSMLR